jgi:shikimate dehydrogenase
MTLSPQVKVQVQAQVQVQVQVTGETRFIGLVGDPVFHVRSPEFYNPRLVRVGANVLLIPIHLPSDRFEAAMPGLLQLGNLAGLIFTAPFKERVARFADEILPGAQQVGAINAMRREPDGRWTADIFDGIGLVRALEAIDAHPAGKRILLLGTGGAGRAIALSLARAGASALTLCDHNPGKISRLAADIARFYPACAVAAPQTIAAKGHNIIVNATPVGMAPGDGLPVPLGPLDPACVVFDIVPKPDVTPLMTYAKEAGCVAAGGRMMIDGQADAVLDFLGFGPKT